MSEMFRCGENEALVEYLYDECDPARRELIAAHLAVCGSCVQELAALSATQEKLAAWQVPAAELGFRLPVETPGVLRPSFAVGPVAEPQTWWRRPLPAWAQAAAAALIFASGLAAGSSRGVAPVSNGNAVASGTAIPSSTALPSSTASRALAPAPAAVVTPASDLTGGAARAVTAHDLAAVEHRLRAEMAQLRGAAPVTVAAGTADKPGEAVMHEVRALIADSERRQNNDVALRLAQVMSNIERQRQVDMRQVQLTVGQLQEFTGAAVRNQGMKVDMLLNNVSFRPAATSPRER